MRHEFSCWVAAVKTHYLVVLVFTCIIYFPRLFLSYFVFGVAQCLRLVARQTGVVGTRKQLANRRILMITDYLPPQTHGIAIRCHAYLKEMRAQGHEVICFATAYDTDKETSFDNPNIPGVINPFNTKNRIGYNPGVKLAWYLGAHSWDVVHVVFPSLIGIFVLPVCAWRRIPVYCSHHVEMDMFGYKHVPYPAIATFGLFMYNLIGKWPAVVWGTLNAAPTLCFARQHVGKEHEEKLRRVPSGTHACFTMEPSAPDERQRVRKTRFGVDDDKTKVVIMVQRLSGEKGTDRIFPAFIPKDQGGQGVPGVIVIAGDGPSKASLMSEAKKRNIRAVFLGNVPHHELPELYRAADCFVTMSLSETFGLTSLEASMCGCPAVMPWNDVFDEIWNDRIPKTWRYDIKSVSELAAAIESAQGGRKYLIEHPVKMTWADAATDLLGQYEECIAMKKKDKEAMRGVVTFIDHIVRIIILTTFATCVLSYYWAGLRRFGTLVSPFERDT